MEDVVTFDRRFTHYEQHADGRVTAHFDDGSRDTGDLLVGADGASSRGAARSTSPTPHTPRPASSRSAARRSLTGRSEALLPDVVRNGLGMYFDRRGQFGITHTMRMPWGEDGAPRDGVGASEREL